MDTTSAHSLAFTYTCQNKPHAISQPQEPHARGETRMNREREGQHGILDGVGGDDGGVVVGGVGREAVGDDAYSDVPLGEDVAAGRDGAAPDAADADAGLAVPALELDAVGHGDRSIGHGGGPDSDLVSARWGVNARCVWKWCVL
jgi:hypothetical protein